MAGKLTAAQGTGILLVTANVGSLFEDVSFSIDTRCLSVLSVSLCNTVHSVFMFTSQLVTTHVCSLDTYMLLSRINMWASHNHTDTCELCVFMVMCSTHAVTHFFSHVLCLFCMNGSVKTSVLIITCSLSLLQYCHKHSACDPVCKLR